MCGRNERRLENLENLENAKIGHFCAYNGVHQNVNLYISLIFSYSAVVW